MKYFGEIICPICKKNIYGYPAISRKDNKTELCSSCGVSEALEIFCKNDISYSNKKSRDS